MLMSLAFMLMTGMFLGWVCKKVQFPSLFGTIVLTVAVLAILITAPLGAFCIEFTYKKLLKKSQMDKMKV